MQVIIDPLFARLGSGRKESSGTGLEIAVLVTGFTLVNTREEGTILE